MPDETAKLEHGAAPARLLVVDDEENIVLTISEVLRLEDITTRRRLADGLRLALELVKERSEFRGQRSEVGGQ